MNETTTDHQNQRCGDSRYQTSANTAPPKDIVDTAVAAGSFGTLVAAVQAAGLVDTLKGDGPFTVFAPTDQAFLDLADALELQA